MGNRHFNQRGGDSNKHLQRGLDARARKKDHRQAQLLVRKSALWHKKTAPATRQGAVVLPQQQRADDVNRNAENLLGSLKAMIVPAAATPFMVKAASAVVQYGMEILQQGAGGITPASMMPEDLNTTMSCGLQP